ncbi:MAG: L-2-hydroxyglutarate oxidase [Carbonactinosporaceae bacterium]
MRRARIGVVGGGILGVAVARRLLELRPETDVTLLEKEDRLAAHQTGRSSGVVHAGIYYAPGSLKARLCRRGVGLLQSFCAERGIGYDECGKLIVACDGEEQVRLNALYERSTTNGVPGMRLVGPAEMGEIEPHVRGVAGLYSPHTAIADFAAVTRALAVEVEERGGGVLTNSGVTRIEHRDGAVLVAAGGAEHVFDLLVICAGLHTDRVARLAGDGDDPRIVPFRGEYYQLRPERRSLVRALIYPVPDPRYPFLGVHLTRRVDGEVLVGPNAVLAAAREGYRRRDVRPADLRETLAWPGFRRLAAAHWRTGAREIWGSLSERAFIRAARRYVPELSTADVVAGPSGVRAQAVARDGSLVDDFRITRRGRVVSVRNAPSPGATSALAIAEHIVDAALQPDAPRP